MGEENRPGKAANEKVQGSDVKVQVVGLSHHNAPISVRERLAFSPEQTGAALEQLRQGFPEVEAVLLSTCNRVELFTATETAAPLTRPEVAELIAICRTLEGLPRHASTHAGYLPFRVLCMQNVHFSTTPL